jgi:cytochrome P450
MQWLTWVVRPLDLLDACARRYGDCFTLRWPGFPPVVVLSDPEAVKDVFAASGDIVFAGPPNAALKPVTGEHSLLILDGPRHLRQRRLMMPSFHGERMLAYGDLIQDAAARTVAEWPQGRVFPLHAQMHRIALEVILRAVLGVTEQEQAGGLHDKLKRMLEVSGSPALLVFMKSDGGMRAEWLLRRMGKFSPLVELRGLLEEIDEILYAEFRRRRASGGEREDILSLLMLARDESGAQMTDAELRDEMMTLIFAGHETSATALCWAVYRLLANPDALARVKAEIAAAAGDGPLAAKDVPRLEYLDAVIKESMRMNPVVPVVGRVLQQPMRVGRYKLPAGVMVLPCVYLTHRRPDLWPDPEQFKPERFLSRKAGLHEFFPFGGGMRRCIGMAFALYEMKVVLAEVITRTALRLKPGYRGRMVRRSVTMMPSQGMPVILG